MWNKLQNNKKKLKIAVGIAISAIAVISIYLLFVQSVGPTEAGFVIVQNYLDAEKTIEYIGNVDDSGAPYGVVMYDAGSPEGLQHYADASQAQGQALVDSGVEELYVWITFRRPVEINAFAPLAEHFNLQVKRYAMRAIGQNGDRIGIMGAPEGSVMVPASQLDRAVKGVQQHENNQAQLQGVFEVIGVIGANDYQRLLRDPRIFMIDVTGTLIYHDPNFQDQTHLNWDEFVARFQIDGSHGGPYWYVEDFGLGASSN